MWEELYCFGYAFYASAWDVYAVASVVVRGRSEVSAPAGESRGVFGVTAVGGFTVAFDKMHESVCMAENFSSPSVANGVGVVCKRALANARAAVMAALVELPAGTGQSCGKNSTVLAMRSTQVRGMYTRWHQ